MKRLMTLFFVLSLMVSNVSVSVCRAEETPAEDTVIDKAGDWVATVGKTDAEKEQIRSERKAKRIKRHADRRAARLQHKADREAEKSKRHADRAAEKVTRQGNSQAANAQGEAEKAGSEAQKALQV